MHTSSVHEISLSHRLEIGRHIERASSCLDDVIDSEILPHFHQSESLLTIYIEYHHISDDSADYLLSSERQTAFLNDLVLSSLRSVLHRDDYSGSRSRDEIHRSSHSLDDLAGNHPIGEISVLGNLHASKKSDVDMRPSNHGEAL
ncbi:hypothetical protein PMAYCL1PPCAC_19699, partial [Pristionchus mayeri]